MKKAIPPIRPAYSRFVLSIVLVTVLSVTKSSAQEAKEHGYTRYFMPELLIGRLKEAGDGFPDRGIQKSAFISWGWYNNENNQEWKYRLNKPRTGITIGFSEYGNTDLIGWSASLYPFLEFHPLNNQKITFYSSLGLSYHSKKFDLVKNPSNKGVSTDFAWAYRLSAHYKVYENENGLFKIGAAYLHHSNGHTRLPNIGYNSFMATFTYEKYFKKSIIGDTEILSKEFAGRLTYNHIEIRSGFGVNVLSHIINDKKPVYTFAAGYGKTINKTFRYSGGFYYRFYQQYYDYIKDEGEYLAELYPEFLNNPYGYATNIGLYGSGEILMNHIGIEFVLGLNLYKPFYQVEWMNNGWWYIHYDEENSPEIRAVKQELDWYFEIKRTVTSRLGIKYYLFGTDQTPQHNFFVSAHINANLGQADFPELSIGYMRSFNFKKN